jgi:hypothetical protein
MGRGLDGQPPLRKSAFLLFALIYLYAFPYFDRLRSANEMPRTLMTQEIVDRGTFRIDARLGEMGSRFDTSLGADGHWYSNKAPGPSFLAVPVYLGVKLFRATSLMASTWAFRVFAVTLPAVLFLPFFYRLCGRFAPDEWSRRLALCAYALGSSALPYGMLFMSHALAAVTAGGSFVAAVTLARGQTHRPKLTGWVCGLLAGLAVMMDYQTVIASVAVAAYLLAKGIQRLRNLAMLALGAAPAALALAAYHKVCFGSPLSTPLSSATDTVTRRGFLGLVGPSKESFAAVILEPSNGLIVLMPWTLLALVGIVAVAASRIRRLTAGAEMITCVVVVAGYLMMMGSLVPSFARSGWCVGPRYMTAALPFLAWMACAGFSVLRPYLVGRVVALAVVLVSIGIFVPAATTFPHWPEFLMNPIHELVYPLLKHGYAVHSAGTAVGLRGLPSLLPLYLGVLALFVWLTALSPRATLLHTALGAALAVGVLTAYQKFPETGPYRVQAWRYVVSIWEPAPRPPAPAPAPASK